MHSNGMIFVSNLTKIGPAVLELKMWTDRQISPICAHALHIVQRTHNSRKDAILPMRHSVLNYVSQSSVKTTFRTNENLQARLTGSEGGCLHIPRNR
jgi:hypothetical protein